VGEVLIKGYAEQRMIWQQYANKEKVNKCTGKLKATEQVRTQYFARDSKLLDTIYNMLETVI
jgi:hypothetical protein